jgi:hypothetical protein
MESCLAEMREGGGLMTSATYWAVADALDEAGDYQLAGANRPPGGHAGPPGQASGRA